MTFNIYCIGKSQRLCDLCMYCNQTPQEFIECPYFLAYARHEYTNEELRPEEVMNLWATRTGEEEWEI